MKIRNGFVSNSSSSSFCIYGTEDVSFGDGVVLLKTLRENFPEEFEKMVSRWEKYAKSAKQKKIVQWIRDGLEGDILESKKVRGCDHKIKDDVKFCPECGKDAWIVEEIISQDDLDEYTAEEPCEIFECFEGLEYITSDGYEAIGLAYESAPDEMTFGEFRAKADDIISKIAGKKVKCKHLEDVVYN